MHILFQNILTFYFDKKTLHFLAAGGPPRPPPPFLADASAQNASLTCSLSTLKIINKSRPFQYSLWKCSALVNCIQITNICAVRIYCLLQKPTLYPLFKPFPCPQLYFRIKLFASKQNKMSDIFCRSSLHPVNSDLYIDGRHTHKKSIFDGFWILVLCFFKAQIFFLLFLRSSRSYTPLSGRSVNKMPFQCVSSLCLFSTNRSNVKHVPCRALSYKLSW